MSWFTTRSDEPKSLATKSKHADDIETLCGEVLGVVRDSSANAAGVNGNLETISRSVRALANEAVLVSVKQKAAREVDQVLSAARTLLGRGGMPGVVSPKVYDELQNAVDFLRLCSERP